MTDAPQPDISILQEPGHLYFAPTRAWRALAGYNVVAARNQLKPLIEAGVRGGLASCVFFAALVSMGLLHPIVLLLPAVDLLSVTWIYVARSGAAL